MTAIGEAGTLIGGPIAYAAYRKARRALGLPDTAVAPAPESRTPSPRARVAGTSAAPGYGRVAAGA